MTFAPTKKRVEEQHLKPEGFVVSPTRRAAKVGNWSQKRERERNNERYAIKHRIKFTPIDDMRGVPKPCR